jgi:hypothetical protein
MGVRFTLEDLQRKGFKVEGLKAEKVKKVNKIAGAVKSEVNGVKFASKLELYLFNLLKSTRIDFEFQVVFVLQEGFKFHGSTIRPMKIIVDFYLPKFDLLVDSKGWQLADSKLKYKLLKRKLLDEGKATKIEMPRTQEECEALVNRLLKSSVLVPN